MYVQLYYRRRSFVMVVMGILKKGNKYNKRMWVEESETLKNKHKESVSTCIIKTKRECKGCSSFEKRHSDATRPRQGGKSSTTTKGRDLPKEIKIY